MHPLGKKARNNRLGEDVYLLPDGSIERDEDKIIAAQRVFMKYAYACKTGIMYKKGLAEFNSLKK